MSNTSDTIKFKALDDDDVNNMLRMTANANPDVINEIYRTYANTLNTILTMVQKQATEEEELVEVDRVKRIINMLPIEERFMRTKDKVWAVQDHIFNKNIKYFLDKDYSHIIKRDSKQVMIETLVELVKNRAIDLQPNEMDFYWNKAVILLNCIGRFKKAIGDYD
jgi:CII-binding regulator of phage lambda lysogenization HflD